VSASGHFGQFPPTSPRVGCRFGQGTFAGTHGNGRDGRKRTFARRRRANRPARPKPIFREPTPCENHWPSREQPLPHALLSARSGHGQRSWSPAKSGTIKWCDDLDIEQLWSIRKQCIAAISASARGRVGKHRVEIAHRQFNLIDSVNHLGHPGAASSLGGRARWTRRHSMSV